MAPRLKLNALDLSPYLRTTIGEGLQPGDPDAVEPQFTGALAFREGQGHVSDAANNYEHLYPLLLEADDRQALLDLISSIERELTKGATLEYRHDENVDRSTFFDIEGGRLEPEYQYAVLSHGIVRANLRVWTQPYGHSGTWRGVIPSAAGSSISIRLATGIEGDVKAKTRFYWRAGSAMPVDRQIFAWGVHPNPSARLVATAAGLSAQFGGTTVGASGAVASTFVGAVIPTAANSEIIRISGPLPAGRSRVYAIGRSRLAPATALQIYARYGGFFDQGRTAGPTVIATQNDSAKWQVLDMGEINVPSVNPSHGVPTYAPGLFLYSRIPSGASTITGSQALQLTAVIFQPLDVSAGAVFNPTAVSPHLVGVRAGDLLGVHEHPNLLVWSSRSGPTSIDVTLTANLRGAAPELLPVGSGGTPMSVLAFGGDIADFRPADDPGWTLSARENWRFLR